MVARQTTAAKNANGDAHRRQTSTDEAHLNPKHKKQSHSRVPGCGYKRGSTMSRTERFEHKGLTTAYQHANRRRRHGRARLNRGK
ncbi:hypothetical protein V6N13_142282 [Hibiscus sabdariffa]